MFLDYEYIKNHYRLIAVDLNRQELETRVKLSNKKAQNLERVAKIKTGTTLRITKKSFQSEELPHELFLTLRQKTEIRNSFTNDMSTDKKFSKAQLSKSFN